MTRVSVIGLDRNARLVADLREMAQQLQSEVPPFCSVELTLRPESKKSREFSLAAKVSGFRKAIIAHAEGWNVRALFQSVDTKILDQIQKIKGQISAQRTRNPGRGFRRLARIMAGTKAS